MLSVARTEHHPQPPLPPLPPPPPEQQESPRHLRCVRTGSRQPLQAKAQKPEVKTEKVKGTAASGCHSHCLVISEAAVASAIAERVRLTLAVVVTADVDGVIDAAFLRLVMLLSLLTCRRWLFVHLPSYGQPTGVNHVVINPQILPSRPAQPAPPGPGWEPTGPASPGVPARSAFRSFKP